jgi:hypothetical protein
MDKLIMAEVVEAEVLVMIFNCILVVMEEMVDLESLFFIFKG